jgi:hypothetical protein
MLTPKNNILAEPEIYQQKATEKYSIVVGYLHFS